MDAAIALFSIWQSTPTRELREDAMLFNILSYIWQSTPARELRVGVQALQHLVALLAIHTHARIAGILIGDPRKYLHWQSTPTHELRAAKHRYNTADRQQAGNPRPRTNCEGNSYAILYVGKETSVLVSFSESVLNTASGRFSGDSTLGWLP